MRFLGAVVALGLSAFSLVSLVAPARAEEKASPGKVLCVVHEGESPFAAFVLGEDSSGLVVRFDVGALDTSSRWKGLGLESGEMAFTASSSGGQASGGGLYTAKSGTTLERDGMKGVMVFPGKLPAVASFACAE
jgi:hypothetical protein